MRRIVLLIVLALACIAVNAQVQQLSGPRIGLVYISSSPGASFLNGDLALGDIYELPEDYNDIAKGAFTSLYGWQWETRFADGGSVTGIVEWVALIGGMERGKFLPSASSMVGARTSSGIEVAAGPTLSLIGLGMVIGVGYNFKSGNLNLPVNIAYIPGMNKNQDEYGIRYHTGNRISITLGFNINNN
tara:strand:+ start:271 stop:834 length:564 start_codon:yes stop_codon:yes gene_type:complete